MFTTYYVTARNEIEAQIQACRKMRAGEQAEVWLHQVTTKKPVWSVTFKGNVVMTVVEMHVAQQVTINVNVLI